MNWIQLDCGYWARKEVLRLVKKLGRGSESLPLRLWCYGQTNQPDGKFSKYEPDELAAILGWDGDADGMVQALRDCGFFDAKMRVTDRGFHEGMQRQTKKKAELAAQARWEKEHSSSPSPDRTGQDGTGQDTKDGEDRRTYIEEHSSGTSQAMLKHRESFERFWECYPKKVNREKAFDEWATLNPDPEQTDIIMQAVEEHAEYWDRESTEGRYIPDPSSWLHKRRWEDQLPATYQ